MIYASIEDVFLLTLSKFWERKNRLFIFLPLFLLFFFFCLPFLLCSSRCRQITASPASLHDMPILACGASVTSSIVPMAFGYIRRAALPAPQAFHPRSVFPSIGMEITSGGLTVNGPLLVPPVGRLPVVFFFSFFLRISKKIRTFAHFCEQRTMQALNENWGACDVVMILHELHQRGYEQLRLHCGMSPNGMAWRWNIYPKSIMDSPNYSLLKHLCNLSYE